MAHLEFFSEDKIALQREVRMHPKLVQQLEDAGPGADFADRIGIAAAYVNIAMDDLYTDKDIDSICSMIISRLQDRRMTIILPH